jgi:uncharacterized membrane protein YjjB (DUF3815 family)
MIDMSSTLQPPEHALRRLARTRGWLIPAAFLGLAPKCVLCLLAYAGLGAALGLGGPEICGASSGATGHWTVWLAALGIATGLAMFLSRLAKRPSSNP